MDEEERQPRLGTDGFSGVGNGNQVGWSTAPEPVIATDPRQQPRFPNGGSWTSPGFRSAETRAKVGQVFYGIVAVTSAALAVVTAGGFELLDRAERFVWEEAAFESWSDSLDAIGAWHSIFAFLASLSLIIWLSRYVDNVPPLGGGTPKRSPRRVIVYWIVPIINLIFLPLIFNDVARRQSPDGKGHRTLVLVWWLLFIFPLVALIWTFPIVFDVAGTDWVRNILALGIIERIAFLGQAIATIVLIRRLQADEDYQASQVRSRLTAMPIASTPPPTHA